VGMLEDGEVQRRLGYHPATEGTAPAFELNRSGAILLAEVWNRALPPGREAALALTSLQDALMWANAAVACNAGPDWRLEPFDVSTHVDDLLEHLEGPLHLRGGALEPGRPVTGRTEGPEGGDPGEIVPDEGLTGTHLSPEAVQGLVERSGPRGPADEIARRSVLEQSPER
jgi:hypothetical protein